MQPNRTNVSLVKQFVSYCALHLKIKKPINITLSVEKLGDVPTAGHFDPQTREIVVAVKNRAIADCLRTIAHELTHMKQLDNGVVFPTEDADLQPYEDEANIMAGRLVRFFGRDNPEIYGDLE